METKIGNNAKHTSQPWDPHILSYGWWKLKIQTALLFRWNWKLFTESTINKSKDNWNIIEGSMNSTKKCNNTINNNKNNLNSKKTGFLSQCQAHTMYDFFVVVVVSIDFLLVKTRVLPTCMIIV